MRPQSYDDLPPPERIIVVVGYPRSGNTWVARLLGDILQSPVGGYKQANPVSTEGMDRPGAYYITQLHALPVVTDSPVAIIDAWKFSVPAWKGEKVVQVIRDPRDIAVSMMHYFDLHDLKTAINIMANGDGIMAGVGPWDEYVDNWDAQLIPTWNIFYGALSRTPLLALDLLMKQFGIKVSEARIKRAIKNQEFETKKKQIEMDGAGRPYGVSGQLKHMRKGVSGDWINHFRKSDGELLHKHFGEMLERYGFEQTPGAWIDELPE